MKTVNELRSLPVMDTGNMNIWWNFALDNWDELCYEESCYDGESRDLPELPKREMVECYVRVDLDDIKTNSAGLVNLKDYIVAFNSSCLVSVTFPEGVRSVDVNDIVIWDSDVNLTIEYIQSGFFDNLRTYYNTYKGYVNSDGNLVAITRTVNETGEVSVLLPEHISYDKTFGISLGAIKDYLYDAYEERNNWSEEVVGE